MLVELDVPLAAVAVVPGGDLDRHFLLIFDLDDLGLRGLLSGGIGGLYRLLLRSRGSLGGLVGDTGDLRLLVQLLHLLAEIIVDLVDSLVGGVEGNGLDILEFLLFGPQEVDVHRQQLDGGRVRERAVLLDRGEEGRHPLLDQGGGLGVQLRLEPGGGVIFFVIGYCNSNN